MLSKDPVYQRTRELLVLKEQLEKQLKEGRREQTSRASRSMTSPATPSIHFIHSTAKICYHLLAICSYLYISFFFRHTNHFVMYKMLVDKGKKMFTIFAQMIL